jgi:saccharopine dehydrogenase-like NADP-dependent oxidoreductase
VFHVVFGAGQVGSSLARLLASRGHRVRVVRRSDAPVGPGIEVLAGDARDPAFVLEATRGAHAVYHCINPSAYTKAAWSAEFPAFGAALIDAAIANDARKMSETLTQGGLVDGATQVVLTDAQATVGAVRGAIQRFAQQMTRG